MVKLFAGEKGEGKTKKLIQMANSALETSDGNIVYIDDDGRNIHELKYKIRLVNTADYPPKTYNEFIAFVYGMLSQNSDISNIYIDSLSGVIEGIDSKNVEKTLVQLENIAKNHKIEFFVTLNCNPNELTDEAKKYLA